MSTTPPQLGYGQRTEAPINAVNVWMRGQPWYQQLLSSWGQNPNNVHLNDAQKQQVIRAAQANGVVVDEGHDGQQVDDSGNFEAKGHGLRNTLLVAGIAAASLATMGAAGVFSGAAAAGSGAAAGGGSAAAGGTLGSVVGAGGAAAGAGAGAAGVGGGALAAAGHFLTSPAGAALAGTAANAFANIYGANKQADAAKYGVDAQTAAQKYAADLQDAAAQRAEAFTRQQAEGGWQSSEHTQHANYDQWRARQDAIMGSLGQQLGINYTPPQYSAGIDPHYTDASAPAPNGSAAPSSASTSAPSGIDWTKSPDQLAADLSAFYKSKGVSDQEVPYWVSKAPELVARGKELNDPQYADKRLAESEVFGGGNTGNAAAPPAARQTLATFASPNFLRYQPTALPTTPYQPGTLGAYVGSY